MIPIVADLRFLQTDNLQQNVGVVFGHGGFAIDQTFTNRVLKQSIKSVASASVCQNNFQQREINSQCFVLSALTGIVPKIVDYRGSIDFGHCHPNN